MTNPDQNFCHCQCFRESSRKHDVNGESSQPLDESQ